AKKHWHIFAVHAVRMKTFSSSFFALPSLFPLFLFPSLLFFSSFSPSFSSLLFPLSLPLPFFSPLPSFFFLPSPPFSPLSSP
ncbi:hypothetical protein ACXWRS_11190, partial [Streptococcus pyogenes]